MSDQKSDSEKPAAAGAPEEQEQEQEEELSGDALGDLFRKRVSAIRELHEQTNLIENAKADHESCLKTLRATNGDRVAYWVSKTGHPDKFTVAEITPKVEQELELIAGKLEEAKAELETKEKELQAFKSKHNIIVRGTPEAAKYEAALRKAQQERAGAAAIAKGAKASAG